jgi:carboxylate-amine ligase
MEWITVDTDSGAQAPLATAILDSLGNTPRIKPELFTSTIEINTDIHHATDNCVDELRTLYLQAEKLLAAHGGALFSSGTHPFSRWQEQQITDDARYLRLLDRMQWMVRRFNIFGIHVHVGMPDGDACIRAMNRLLPVMPVFLAISANSPFWQGHDTGLAACRIKVFEGLSQGGMPFYFEDWRDFEHCAARLMATGSIDSVRDIWWEMRPHPDFGTLEIRIGDMPVSRNDTTAYIAYVRAEAMSAVSRDEEDVRVHPSLVRENRWRACRYGIQAELIDPRTEAALPVCDWLEQRLAWLSERGADADDLKIVARQLPHWRQIGDGAMQQRRMHRHEDFKTMVRDMRAADGWHA